MAIKDFLLDLIFPKFCLQCGREGTMLCAECVSAIDPQWDPLDFENQKEVLIGRLISLGYYREKIWQRIIQNLKYQYVTELESALENLVGRFIQKYPESIGVPYDYLVPVPLHRKRLLERGFNQAEIIARLIGKNTGWPLESENLYRKKNTAPQAQLEDEKRKANLVGAFGVRNPERFENKKILLIDDVYTTGSTIKECASTLLAAGAAEVGAWVVARRT
ncbi:MAG: ComF family protein [Patescibacteria group bacterium]|nr:ComF family protein [Patescibacteria group bacterium]